MTKASRLGLTAQRLRDPLPRKRLHQVPIRKHRSLPGLTSGDGFRCRESFLILGIAIAVLSECMAPGPHRKGYGTTPIASGTLDRGESGLYRPPS